MLQSKLDTVNRHLEHLGNGDFPNQEAKGRPRLLSSPKRVTNQLRHRGSLQKSVLKVLKGVGAMGLVVNELASLAKVKPASLRVWLYTKGKTVAGMKKVAPGTFAYVP
jgi:hypothetical protein